MTETYRVTHEEAVLVSRRLKLPGIIRPTPAPVSWAEGLRTAGVTGTNGKSSTTHLLAHLLRGLGDPVLEKTTLGCWVDELELHESRDLRGYLQSFGTLRERGGHLAAVEVTSHALATGYAKFWRFDVGVFTNLSRDHLKAHGSWEHYLASKAQLFVHLPDDGAAILNARDSTSLLLDQIIPPNTKRLWYAAGTRAEPIHEADLSAESLSVDSHGTHVELQASPLAESLGMSLDVPFVGEVYAENALAAVLAALELGVPARDIRERMPTCPPLSGRFQVVYRDPLVVIDFAHTPDALTRLCATARQVVGSGKVIVVFGAGGGADPEKRVPMGEAVGKAADYAFVTNDNPRLEVPQEIAQTLAKGCRRGGRAYTKIILDRRSAIAAALELAKAQDIIVVAGKGHEQGQETAGVVRPFSDLKAIQAELGIAVGDEALSGSRT